MAELTLKTLPDVSKLDDKKTYTIKGVHLRTIIELLNQLWRGDNIGNSSTVKKNANGDSGYNLTSNPPGTPSSSTGTPIVYTPYEILTSAHSVSGVPDGTTDITLWPGVLNGVVASNYSAVINQAISSTQYVFLTCTTDGYTTTSYSWSVSGTPNAPTAATADLAPTSFTYLIGVILWNSSNSTFGVFQVVFTNLSAVPVISLTVSRTGTMPFESPNQYYWSWLVNAA